MTGCDYSLISRRNEQVIHPADAQPDRPQIVERAQKSLKFWSKAFKHMSDRSGLGQPRIPRFDQYRQKIPSDPCSRCQQIVNPILNRRCAKMAFLEVPLGNSGTIRGRSSPSGRATPADPVTMMGGLARQLCYVPRSSRARCRGLPLRMVEVARLVLLYQIKPCAMSRLARFSDGRSATPFGRSATPRTRTLLAPRPPLVVRATCGPGPRSTATAS